MTDLTLVPDGTDFGADLATQDDDLLTGDDLVTAIVISLFTDLGWWADDLDGETTGSRLSELRRAKRTQDTLNRATDYCSKALAWLKADGVARSVTVTTGWVANQLAIGIALVQADGTSRRFAWVWDPYTGQLAPGASQAA